MPTGQLALLEFHWSSRFLSGKCLQERQAHLLLGGRPVSPDALEIKGQVEGEVWRVKEETGLGHGWSPLGGSFQQANLPLTPWKCVLGEGQESGEGAPLFFPQAAGTGQCLH